MIVIVKNIINLGKILSKCNIDKYNKIYFNNDVMINNIMSFKSNNTNIIKLHNCLYDILSNKQYTQELILDDINCLNVNCIKNDIYITINESMFCKFLEKLIKYHVGNIYCVYEDILNDYNCTYIFDKK